MQGEGARALLDTKVCRPPPGLESLGSTLLNSSCKVRPQQPMKIAVTQHEQSSSACTTYRSVAARATKEGVEGQTKSVEPQEAGKVEVQTTSRGRGGSSRSTEKQLKEGKCRRSRGGAAKDGSSSAATSKQGERRQHIQERRLQEEIKTSCPLPKLDESVENPQELLKLKTLFVGELENGQPRRRPPIDPETGRLMYWDRRCYSFGSGGATCASGVQCIFCHTIEELLLHPARFRSELMAPGGENAWYCATSIAELRSRAPEAYGLDSHLRRLQSTHGQEGLPSKAEKLNKHTAEKPKVKQGTQAILQQMPKKPQLAKQQRQQQQQQQQAGVRQTSGVAQPTPKHSLGEDVRACSSSSTEVNSIEDSCGSSSGCCSGGDCGVLCEFTPAASPMPAGSGGAMISSSDSDQNKSSNGEAVSTAQLQLSPDSPDSLQGVKEEPGSPAASCSRSGEAEATLLALTAKGTRLAFAWSDQDGALNLSSFKVFPCRHKHSLSHDKKYCPFYHNFRDKRRGQFCAFAHSREEVRAPLFSVSEETNPTVLFAEFRLMANRGYGSEPCPAWNKDVHSADYGRRCPHGTLCPYSHGSKEQLYHPSYYKTMPCMDYRARDRGGVSCPRGTLCAFYHEASERRWPVRISVDYSIPLPPARNALLQPQFLRPPLFNLDDFEAFGHTSRKTNSRKELAAPETTTSRARGNPRRADSGAVNSGRSPPPPVIRRRVDQASGQNEAAADCSLDDLGKQQPQDGTQQSQLLLMQQPYPAIGDIVQPFSAARASSFPNGLVFKQQQQQQQQFAEAKALSLPMDFPRLAAVAPQWPAEAHQRRVQAAKNAGKDGDFVLLGELGLGLGSDNSSCSPPAPLSQQTQMQQHQMLQLQKLDEPKHQRALQQLTTGFSPPNDLNNAGFSSWLLKRFSDEDTGSSSSEALPTQGSKTTPGGLSLLRRQDTASLELTISQQKPVRQQHVETSLEIQPSENTPTLWRPLGDTASLGGQVVNTPRRSDGLVVGAKSSVIAAPQLGDARSMEGTTARNVGLFDSSGVWSAAHADLYLAERATFGNALSLQENPNTEGADVVSQLLAKESYTPETRFSTQGRGSTVTTGEELSESAARLPPVPPPSLHWYCRQTPDFSSGSAANSGDRRWVAVDGVAQQQSEQRAALSRAAGASSERMWMADPCIGEDTAAERLFNSAMSLQRLVTFESDPGQDQLRHQTSTSSAPFSFSLGVGVGPSESSLPNGLLGTQIASVYLVTPEAGQQERALMRLVRAKTSPKMLLLHNAATDVGLKAELQRSAATVGYSMVSWEDNTDGGKTFWAAPGASLGLRHQPSGAAEVAELLEKAAACGSHVSMLYVHSNEKELGDACTRLASYFASAPVVAAQKRLFVLHLCPAAPSSTIIKHLLPHLVTLSLPRLKRWSAMLSDDPQLQMGSASSGCGELSAKTRDNRKQQQQPFQGSEGNSGEEPAKDSKDRRLMSLEEMRAVVSPTYSVYSLPCMHEDLQWNDECAQGMDDSSSSLQQLKGNSAGLITVLRKELEDCLATDGEDTRGPKTPPCVLLQVEEAPAVVAPPPGLPALPLNGLRRIQHDESHGRQGPLQQMMQEVASLGFTLLQEDRAVKAWSEQLGASLAVAREVEDSSTDQQPHSWARWGVRRLASSRSNAVLFRRTVVTENYDLLDAFRLLAEVQSAAGDCRGIMRCVKAIIPPTTSSGSAGAAVYLQPPTNARAAGALWVGSLQQLVLGNGPVAVAQKAQGLPAPRGSASAQEGIGSQSTIATPCCVCGGTIEAVAPPSATCLHRHHSSCGEVLRAGGCWPCPCALLWPTRNPESHEEQDAPFPSQALRQLVLELCDAVTEAYGLLHHIHAAAYGHSERQRGICFSVGPRDVIVSASCDGILSVCIDVASPHVLRAAMLPPERSSEAPQDSLGTVLGKLVAFLLTRGRATSPPPGAAPLMSNMLGTLWHSNPSEVHLCRNHPFFWSSADRLSFLQVALALTHLPQAQQQGEQQQDEPLECAWGAKLATQLRGLCCTGRSWLLAKACRVHLMTDDTLVSPPALAILNLVDNSELSSQEVQVLLKEVGLETSVQQKQQQQRLLLVQHADEALSRHMEIEVPELLLSVFVLARGEPAVLESTIGSLCFPLLRIKKRPKYFIPECGISALSSTGRASQHSTDQEGHYLIPAFQQMDHSSTAAVA
ncbi:hypothetical protein ACSSS7_000026 [Eimeria intestinalis]